MKQFLFRFPGESVLLSQVLPPRINGESVANTEGRGISEGLDTGVTDCAPPEGDPIRIKVSVSRGDEPNSLIGISSI